MNTKDVLKYGHLWVLKHVEGLTDEQWEAPGVCGYWSVKDIIAHLASYEDALAGVLGTFLGEKDNKTLEQFGSMRRDDFNALQVGLRKERTPSQVLDEYVRFNSQVMELVDRLNPEIFLQVGAIPWYGEEYDLQDMIAYAFYGHKREHCAQIAVYRDTLKE